MNRYSKLARVLPFIFAVAACQSQPQSESVRVRELVFVDASGDTVVIVAADSTNAGGFYYLDAARETLMTTDSLFDMLTALRDLFSPFPGTRSVSRTRERQQRREEAQRIIDVQLLHKAFDKYGYREYISFRLRIRNNSDRDIRAFRGIVTFQDLFGEAIKSVRFTHDDPIGAGETATWNGTIDYNEYIDEDRKLRFTDLDDMSADFRLTNVIYADGTRESF